jgi:hypothetical protein
MEGINETKLGMPADYYIPNIFVANKGDSITMHFYNLDADVITQLLHLKLEMESTDFIVRIINQL